MNAEKIFHEAVEISDPKERAAFLDRACRNDDKLRIAVKALLQADEAAGDFLEVPAIESGVTLDKATSIEGPGTKIGRYKLLELIGEGGMGLVYLAEQAEPVKRRVALKVIKPGMDSKEVIARFESERQALALLDHPNIAHVFDAGTTDSGRPYFVMEYVKGMSITRYCDEHKLNIEQRLKLFREVCEGVHYAHQKGIIHRDIKPSNILVSLHGDRSVPKIIDFGIAKAAVSTLTEKTIFTFHGELLGTPEYMSPEQVDLATQDIDTRSDIYSLGVVLYELLTGVLPFEIESLQKVGLAELQHTIRELEPASPSIRLSNLGQKAKVIADNRMTQVIPLARRLHRELEWIPLKAMRKDRCRRYKSASDMADDIQSYLNGNPLLAGPETAMYRVQKFVHKHAGSVATAALLLVVIVIGLVVSILMGCRAEQARKQEVVARTEAEQARDQEIALRKQLEQALARAEQAESIAQQQRKLAEMNFKKARGAVDQLIQLVEEFGRIPDMEELSDSPQVAQIKKDWLEIALNYYEGFLEERSSDLNIRYETAHAYLRVGDITRNLGQYKRAEETYSKAINLLEELAADFSNELEYHLDIASAYHGYGEMLSDTGRLKEKNDVYQKAVISYGKAIELDPDNGDYWCDRAYVYREYGQLDKALDDYNRAIELNPDNGSYWSERAEVYSRLEQWDKALTDLSKAIELDPNDSWPWYLRADLYTELEQWDSAISDYTKAIELDPGAGWLWGSRAVVYRQLGQLENALADYSKAIELDPGAGWLWGSRAGVYRRLGQLDEALADSNKAIELEPGNEWYWRIRADVYIRLEQWDNAISDNTKAIELDPNDSWLWVRRAVVYMRLGQWEKVLSDISEAIELDPGVDWLWGCRAVVYGKLKKWDKALADFEQNLRMVPDENNDGYPDDAGRLNNFARFLATCPGAETRDGARAIEYANQACILTNWQNADYIDTLAAAYAEAGDFESAVEWQKKVIDLLSEDTSNEVRADFESRLKLYQEGKPFTAGSDETTENSDTQINEIEEVLEQNE